MNRDESKLILLSECKMVMHYSWSEDRQKQDVPHSYLSDIKTIRLIDKIYDNFEAQLKEKDVEITRLRSQISRGHDSQCSCSFCKPSFIYGEPNVHETATTEKD